MLQPTAGQSLLPRLRMPCLLLVLTGGVVAFLRDHLDAGSVYTYLDFAVFAVDEGFVAVVADGVLGAYLFDQLNEVVLNGLRPELGVALPACRGGVARQHVIPHLQRQVNTLAAIRDTGVTVFVGVPTMSSERNLDGVWRTAVQIHEGKK